MWSHYACGHKGLCLQFENKVGLFAGRSCESPINIRYSSRFPLVSEMAEPAEHIKKTILTKSHRWRYEYEWRFIDPDGGPGYRAFDARFLSGVIFGAQMSTQDKEHVRKWISLGPTNPRLFQATIKPQEFALTISPTE